LIIAAGECRDGFPEHGLFYQLLSGAPNLAELVKTFGDGANARPDQWQVQVLARVLDRATVVVHNDVLTVDQLADVHLGATSDISRSVESGLACAGEGARACVLPEGPQTIPYLA
jgi:hypothetical protein